MGDEALPVTPIARMGRCYRRRVSPLLSPLRSPCDEDLNLS